MCTRTLNGGRRIAAVSITVLSVWLAGASMARADVKATIRFTLVETRVSPRQEVVTTPITTNFQISDDKGVDSSSSTGLKGQRMRLGGASAGFSEAGDPMTSTVRIVGGAFVVTNRNPGFYSVLRLTTDGRTTCSATLKYFRTPGHQYFEAITTNGQERIMASNFTAENMTCSIGE